MAAALDARRLRRGMIEIFLRAAATLFGSRAPRARFSLELQAKRRTVHGHL